MQVWLCHRIPALVGLHRQRELWSVSGSRAGSGFPKTQESCAHGWSGPWASGVTSSAGWRFRSGFCAKARGLAGPTLPSSGSHLGCLCLCHAVFLRAPYILNASFEVSCSARGELHLPGFCFEHTFAAFAWSTHSKWFFLPPQGEERPDVLCSPTLSTLVPLVSFQLLVAL